MEQKQNNKLMPWRPYKTIGYVDIAGHPKYNNMSILVIICSIYHFNLQRDCIYILFCEVVAYSPT